MRHMLMLILLITTYPVWAAERIQVLAVFPGKAMLEIDGDRSVLSEGQTHTSGVTLVKALKTSASVLVDGKAQEIHLGSGVNASFNQRRKKELRILGANNSFYTNIRVNGRYIRALVDTGANYVSISENAAKRLGLDYKKARRLRVETASGVSAGYRVKLDRLRMGELQFYNVDAIVVQGGYPRHMLLGMNVLGKLELEQKNNVLILREKY